MRLGCYGTIEDAAAVRAAGFDFLEVSVQHVLCGDMPSDQWDRQAPDTERLPLPIEAANRLLPPIRPVIGPRRDPVALQDYMQRVAKRAQRLGIAVLGFGSAEARHRPDDIDPETAHDHLIEFTSMAAEVCAHHGVALAIEPLSHTQTNTINTLAQARRLCDHVSHPNVAVLVDSCHYALAREEEEDLLELGDLLRHVHIAELVGRVQPGGHGYRDFTSPDDFPSHDAYDFASFFSLLRKTGYDARISVQAQWTAPIHQIGPQVVDYLRKCWVHAGRSE